MPKPPLRSGFVTPAGSVICERENMEYDDKIRTTTGLAVCLRDMGNGKSRIFIDDVQADKKENPINWQHQYFYTFTPEFDNNTIDGMDLSNEEFQNIGVAVVARLLALSKRIK